MPLHTLDATPTTVTGRFARNAPAVLQVDSGDQVTISSFDVLGHLHRFTTSGNGVPRVLPDHQGLTVSGPVEVRRARPGMVLAVHVLDLVPDGFGWTMSGWQGSPLEESLQGTGQDTTWLTWDLDVGAGVARSAVGPSVDLRPFLGIIGLPPVDPHEDSLLAPHSSGGDLDCRELVARSVLHLPVTVPGAMPHVGDGYGAQGDGEVSGTVIECGMRSTLRVELIDGPALDVMHAETSAGRVTSGLSPDLNEATTQALDAMLTWIQRLHDVARATALALRGPARHPGRGPGVGRARAPAGRRPAALTPPSATSLRPSTVQERPAC